jgi:hypothetical protein
MTGYDRTTLNTSVSYLDYLLMKFRYFLLCVSIDLLAIFRMPNTVTPAVTVTGVFTLRIFSETAYVTCVPILLSGVDYTTRIQGYQSIIIICYRAVASIYCLQVIAW